MYCSGLTAMEHDYITVVNIMMLFVEGFHEHLLSTSVCNAHKLL